MEITKLEKVKYNAKLLKLELKVRDEFYARLMDENGNEIIDYEGYVPDFMPGKHYGDYVFLDIDMDTGQILNWRKDISQEDIEKFVNKSEEN